MRDEMRRRMETKVEEDEKRAKEEKTEIRQDSRPTVTGAF